MKKLVFVLAVALTACNSGSSVKIVDEDSVLKNFSIDTVKKVDSIKKVDSVKKSVDTIKKSK
jgi:uncharacterized protein YcfL